MELTIHRQNYVANSDDQLLLVMYNERREVLKTLFLSQADSLSEELPDGVYTVLFIDAKRRTHLSGQISGPKPTIYLSMEGAWSMDVDNPGGIGRIKVTVRVNGNTAAAGVQVTLQGGGINSTKPTNGSGDVEWDTDETNPAGDYVLSALNGTETYTVKKPLPANPSWNAKLCMNHM